MSKVIIDINILRTVLREYFTEPFYHQLMGDLNDNEVFVKDCCPEDFSPWIPVDKSVPKDNEVYEVTAVTEIGCGPVFREYAYYNPTTKTWRSHFSGALLHVLAWKPHVELFYLPFA